MSTPLANISAGRVWPKTHEERRDEYQRRIDAATNQRYDDTTIKSLGLFRATDAEGNYITHETRRVTPDGPYVTDVDAGILSSNLTLNLADEAPVPGYVADEDGDTNRRNSDAARLLFFEEGKRIWTTSRIKSRARDWAWMLAASGDYYLESITEGEPGALQGRVVGHRPDHVEPFYDENGLDLIRCDIRYKYSSPPDDEGEVTEHDYYRQVLPGMVRTRIDNGEWEEVETNVGALTITRVTFLPSQDPKMGRHAACSIEDPASVADSVTTMMSTIGARQAGPLYKVIGALLDTPADSAQMGKVFNLPQGADMSILEASLTGISAFVQFSEGLMAQARQTVPEFLFTEASANASGTALSHRAAHLAMKIGPVSMAFREAIARAINVCLCMEEGLTYSEDRTAWFQVDGGAVLPQDKASIASLLSGLVDSGMLRLEDAVRALQALDIGIPEDADPAEYAETAQLENEARNGAAAELLQAIAGQQSGGTAAADEDDDTPADEPEYRVGDTTASIDIVKQVASGDLPRESGLAILVNLVGLTPQEAKAVMGKAGGGFVPRSSKDETP